MAIDTKLLREKHPMASFEGQGSVTLIARNDLLALCDAYDALAELVAVEDADIPLSEFKQRHREAVKRARQLLGRKP